MARGRALIRALAGGAAAIALALGGAAIGATAAAADVDAQAVGGSISGVVTRADDGAPVEGVTVSAYGTVDGWGSATTGADGTYTIEGLADDSYVVSFFADGTDLKRQYWPSVAEFEEATPVLITEGMTVLGVDAALVAGASIEGVVTRSADGSAVVGADVQALDSRNEIIGHGQTDASGAYSIGGLPAGTYRVRFGPSEADLMAEFWKDAYTWDYAQTVALTEGETVTGVDAALEAVGYISGTVTRGSDGAPLSTLIVIYQEDDLVGIPDVRTDIDGTFRAAVPAGNYKLRFLSTGFADVYWENAAAWETATVLTVVAGEETGGIDAVLEPAGSISGTVSVDGPAVSKIWVEAWVGGQHITTRGADPVTGAYTLALPYGDYILKARVVFADGTTTAQPQYFDGVASAAEATPVRLAPAGTVTGIDFDLVADTSSPPRPALSLSAGSVRAGGELSVFGTGFTPGEVVAFELHSEPIALGSLIADGAGRIEGALRIPATAPVGAHTLVALRDGTAIQASVALQVTAAATVPAASGAASDPGDTLAATGGELPTAALVTGLLLAMVGAALVRRRRAHG